MWLTTRQHVRIGTGRSNARNLWTRWVVIYFISKTTAKTALLVGHGSFLVARMRTISIKQARDMNEHEGAWVGSP
jgi:hypothetical protein